MTDRQSRRWCYFKVISVILFLLVAYPLSYGPLIYFLGIFYDSLPEPVAEITAWIIMSSFYPIEYLCDSDWLIDTTLVEWYNAYINFWEYLHNDI